MVAVPDHFHHGVIRQAWQRDQHVLTVKPLVLKYAQAVEIERIARQSGLFVGVEYHKRFDRRALDARLQYRRGRFGRSAAARPSSSSRITIGTRTSRTGSPARTAIRSRTSAATTSTWSISSPDCGRSRSPSAAWRGGSPTATSGYLWSIGQVIWENGADPERHPTGWAIPTRVRARTTRGCACSAKATTAARCSATTTSSAA